MNRKSIMKDDKPKSKPQEFHFPKFQADYLKIVYENNHGTATELLRLNLDSRGIKPGRIKNG